MGDFKMCRTCVYFEEYNNTTNGACRAERRLWSVMEGDTCPRWATNKFKNGGFEDRVDRGTD